MTPPLTHKVHQVHPMFTLDIHQGMKKEAPIRPLKRETRPAWRLTRRADLCYNAVRATGATNTCCTYMKVAIHIRTVGILYTLTCGLSRWVLLYSRNAWYIYR